MKVSNMTFESYDNSIYKLFMNINGTAAIIFGFFGMYLILAKSPKTFGSYKYFLLNISFWSFVFDFYVTVLYTPKLLFPAIVMCPTGFLQTDSNTIAYVEFWIYLIFFGCITVAITSSFFYRYAALKCKLDKFLSWKCLTLIGLMHVVYEVPTLILDVLSISDRKAIDKAILTQWPNIAPYYTNMGCASMHLEVTYFPIIFMCFLIAGFTLGIPVVSFLVYKSFSILNEQKGIMSPKTYRMHRRLLIMLILQLLVPSMTIFGPFMVDSILIFAGVEHFALFTQMAFISATLHSTLNTLMMLYFIHPYRQAFYKMIKMEKKNSVASASAEANNESLSKRQSCATVS